MKRNMVLFLAVFLVSFLWGEKNKKLTVNSVNLRGNISLNSSQLMSVVRTKPSSLFKKQYFDRRLVKFDAISLKTFFVSQGFLNATVKDSVALSDEFVDIYFLVNEGKCIFLKHIELIHNNTLPDLHIIELLGIKINTPYNPIGLNKNLTDLKSEYERFGKLFAQINIYESIEDSAEVLIEIKEGKKITVESFSIEGTSGIKNYLVERELIFKKGNEYNKDEIDLSQRRLLETGIFSFAQISPTPIPGSDSTVHLGIHVKQFKPREWRSIGGYYPIEYYEGAEPLPGAGAEFGWRNRGLNSTTTNFNTKLAGYFIPTQEFVYPKITFNVDLGNQWFLQKRVPTQIGLFYETFKPFGRYSDPLISRYGFKIINQNNLNERSYLLSELKWEKFYESEALEQRTYTLTGFFDETNHLIIPTSGYRITGSVNISGGILGGSKSFFKVDFGYNHYKMFLEKYVFAGRFKIGRIFGWDTSNSNDSQYDLFYLGGSSSLRGWDMLRFHTDLEGNPKGSIFRILSNWEIRFPLFWILGGELFVDGGILTNTLTNQALRDFLWNAGFGITIATPLAPFRLDFALPLDGKNSWKMQMGANYIF